MVAGEIMDDTTDKKELDEIHKRAIKRFDICADSLKDIHDAYRIDTEFRSGKQWADADKTAREADKRPCLTIDKVHSLCNSIENSFRGNRPQVKVRPVDSQSSQNAADIRNGLIRHIMNNGDCKNAIDTSFGHSVTGGIGAFKATGTK